MLGLRDFICELADRKDDRIEPQKNHLVKARFFHGSKMRGGGKETKKKSIQSLQMCMFWNKAQTKQACIAMWIPTYVGRMSFQHSR